MKNSLEYAEILTYELNSEVREMRKSLNMHEGQCIFNCNSGYKHPNYEKEVKMYKRLKKAFVKKHPDFNWAEKKVYAHYKKQEEIENEFQNSFSND